MLLADLMNGQREIWEMMKEVRPSIPWHFMPIALTVTDEGYTRFAMPLIVEGNIFHHLKTEEGETINQLYVNVLHRIQVKRWKPQVSTQPC
jgi:hypothetical protein